MISRFQGDGGRRLLVEALAGQTATRHDVALANRIADACELRLYEAGQALIEQDGPDNEVFFILTGSAEVFVHGVHVARRDAGCHVGEMAAIDPSARRSATVVACAGGAVAAIIGEPTLSAIASEFPALWRAFAVELGNRLRQRGSLLRPANTRPKLFIGCSVEGLPIGRSVQEHLEHDAIDVTVWTDDVFIPGGSNASSLIREAQQSDFGLFVARPDDVTRSRGTQTPSPRDNVILELGMFLGLHGTERALILQPRGADLKIPTDLLGHTPLEYEADLSVGDPVGATAVAVNRLRRHIAALGPRR